MLLDVRPVWVIQQKSTGRFLNEGLWTVASLKFAGRCHDHASAVDTAEMHLGDDWEIHQFYEVDEEQRSLVF